MVQHDSHSNSSDTQQGDLDMRHLRAIDVHAHYGEMRRDLFRRASMTDLELSFISGDAEEVVERARWANTEFTIVSPCLGIQPRGSADAVAGNQEAQQVVGNTDGLLQWVIVHPQQQETYRQAERMLESSNCVGIKIHPEEHTYPIVDHGRTLFEFAARHRAFVLAHSGDERSLPMDFMPFINEFPEVSLILAHLGNGGRAAGDPSLQVQAIQASRHGNVYTDTSSARSMLPKLIEWAANEIGPDRILFGTDTPIYFAPAQRARIDHAALPDHQKRLILRDNAVTLLKRHGTDINDHALHKGAKL